MWIFAEAARTKIFSWATSFCSAHNFTSFYLTQNIKLTIVNSSFAAPASVSYHWWVQAAFNVNWRQASRSAGRIPTFLHSSRWYLRFYLTSHRIDGKLLLLYLHCWILECSQLIISTRNKRTRESFVRWKWESRRCCFVLTFIKLEVVGASCNKWISFRDAKHKWVRCV